MEKRELQKLLNQPYKQENWKEIVQFVFPNVSILATPKEFPISNDKIKKFCQIGNVRLNDGKNLALFELILGDSVNLQRNRVELNNEISKYIDQEQVHGVLSVFEQGGDDYRFTFSARSTEFDEEESDFVQKKTDTKRFTYVLGKNESCKTPADRFFKLSEKKSEADISAIQHAFSVEQLSKEFFDKYKKQFDKFWTYINSNKDFKTIFFGEEREKGIRDFTKKLLGRIVFLHFLQKKGWMGCAAETSNWEDGDKQFMQNLLEAFEDKEHFHSKCLAELFFNTLNRKRTEDLFVCIGLGDNLNNTKVPYLNGGLFDSGEIETRKIDFPIQYFEDLLEFFGQYNFTIDENDPNDHEVGIDPEMLGHIFENLLEDNKDKGAFYTPKVIVQYMCQESLIEYISTKLDAEGNTEAKEALENLVRNRLAEKCSDLDLVEPIAQALYDVKVCDPAIGSGAFPMGILNTIYQVVEELYWIQPDSVARVWNISDTEWQPHLVKKNIIQNSIYGVDIESGAVDIARLRFWLALVVDEIEPLPLPNLDYKIMQGNSLLESFEGIDLSEIGDAKAYETVLDEKKQMDLFTGEVKSNAKISALQYEDVKALMNEYFNANDPDTKKDLHKRIDDQVLNHIRFTLTQHKQELIGKSNTIKTKLKLDEAAFSTWLQKEKIRSNSKKSKELDAINKELAIYLEKEIKLAQISNSNERPFFLWNLFFQEVLKQGGFDIVIANPPYIGQKENNLLFKEIKKSPLGVYHQRRMDYFYFFFHQAINISKPKGIISFITTNYYITASSADKLRADIKTRTSILRLINFNELRIFESALGQHNIISILTKDTNSEKIDVINVNRKGNSNSNLLKKILYNDDPKTNYFHKLNSNVFDGELNYIRINSNQDLNSNLGPILDKMRDEGTPLTTICDITQGIVTGADKLSQKHISKFNLKGDKGDGIFAISKIELTLMNLGFSDLKFIKPWFKNSDISRWTTNIQATEYLIYYTSKTDKKIGPELLTHFEEYKPILINRNTRSGTPILTNEDYMKFVSGNMDISYVMIASAFKRGDYYCISYARDIEYFTEPKIVIPQRSKFNTFGYNEVEWFAASDVHFIISKNNKIDLKYILALLNSKLYYHWLYNRGKRKGEILELVLSPLSEIPIKVIEQKRQTPFVKLANQIIEAKKNGKEIKLLEDKLNALTYKLFELNYSDILLLENDNHFSVTKDEYDKIEI